MNLLFLDESPGQSSRVLAALSMAGFSGQSACHDLRNPLETLFESAPANAPAPFALVFLWLENEAALSKLKTLRAHPALEAGTFIVLAEPENEPLCERALQIGAFDYLLSPEISPRALLRLLRHAEARQTLPEALLRQSEQRYKLVVAATQTGFWEWDLRTDAAHFSDIWKSQLGYAPEELAAHSLSEWSERVHPEDLSPTVALTRTSIENPEIPYSAQFRMRHKNGHWVWIASKGSVLRDAHGQAQRFLGTHSDITARKEAEEALRELNARLEERVSTRTSELAAANADLHRRMAECKRLEAQILEMSERAQSRLGHDLHDGLGQELAGIALLCKALGNRLQAEAHPLAGNANDLCEMLSRTICSARDMATGFYPVELERGGLGIALHALANQVSTQFGIDCEYLCHGAPIELQDSARIHLYRLVQEAVANAIEHGHAHKILIESRCEDGIRSFSITDNGVGYPNSPKRKTGGIGLHLIHYRARLIGAEVSFEVPRTGGCRVVCHFARVRPSARRPAALA